MLRCLTDHAIIGVHNSMKGKQGQADLNQSAFSIVQLATGEIDATENEAKKNPAAVALGRLGGLKGGKARAESLTSERRAEIAKLAAQKRWAKQ